MDIPPEELVWGEQDEQELEAHHAALFGDEEGDDQDGDDQDAEFYAAGADALPMDEDRPRAGDQDDPHPLLDYGLHFPGVDGAEAQRLEDDQRRVDEEALNHEPSTILRFGGRAGEAIAQHATLSTFEAYRNSLDAGEGADNSWTPFRSKLEWEIARWAKMRGPTSTAFTELLQIDEVRDRLQLSFNSSKALNKIIDTSLPSIPEFKCEDIVIDGESYELYYRDIMQCVRHLYGNPEFLSTMAFAPECHFTDDTAEPADGAASSRSRIYGQMHTGKWWWHLQTVLENKTPGATVVPLIFSSDKTLVTDFRNKSAYPLYMTIGNISKEDRRKPSKQAQILVGYLPTARLTHIKTLETRRRAVANLFHATPALHGVKMASGDGVVRRCHPIFAVFIGDYPEQVLVTCVKSGECPKCVVYPDAVGDHMPTLPSPRSISAAREALSVIDRGPEEYITACQDAGIKPVYHPFWDDLPYSNVFMAITPDILHQLYQGMVKHLINWLTDAYGATEIDARCARLPPNHNVRLFKHGITILSRVSGQEHKDVCRILLGLIIDLELPDKTHPREVVRTVRALLDFLYLAQYPSHSDATLKYLDKALKRFHASKHIFEVLGIRQGFNIPKLHNLAHYVQSIKLFGTTDNTNTEATERLHIDYAKDAYRATNHKDVYPQMTKWLVRREQILRHSKFVQWRVEHLPGQAVIAPAPAAPRARIHIARNPSDTSVTFAQLAHRHGTENFEYALACYILAVRNPGHSSIQIANLADGLKLPFRTVATYNNIKFWLADPQAIENAPETRYRVAQVRAIFSLPLKAREAAFPPDYDGPKHLAFIEWFSPFARAAEPDHLLYRIRRAYMAGGARRSAVIPVESIRRTVHLFPRFGPATLRYWTSANVLDTCDTFYVSSFVDRHTYITIY
ncbi:hypothetical protein FA95DRAFT_1585098 [Auriscalpium vulgare]|uniref:Uncharacterized protein n=1 Tax=Auriscalpium vulgare TaxID=40419 RepID=A0ACB8R844_9AGAM|nr:hypothetical protein FA95DRAFT_1585098 [Auriscalpium vulgare]